LESCCFSCFDLLVCPFLSTPSTIEAKKGGELKTQKDEKTPEERKRECNEARELVQVADNNTEFYTEAIENKTPFSDLLGAQAAANEKAEYMIGSLGFNAFETEQPKGVQRRGRVAPFCPVPAFDPPRAPFGPPVYTHDKTTIPNEGFASL